jgi:hypothetical protein
MVNDVIKPDGCQDVRRETWMHRSVAQPYIGSPSTTTADPETVARWVGRLRSVVDADGDRRAPSYWLGRLNVSGALHAQVLAAYEAAE